MTRLAIAIALAVSGCVSSAYNQLPAYQRAAFERCEASVMQAACGPEASADPFSGCYASTRNRYAEASPRDHWLIGHGCQPAVVYYGQ